MDVQNLTTLRDYLAKLPDERFDMGQWTSANRAEDMIHDCGTCGCIGGWAEAISGQAASVWLDLTDYQSQLLFNPFHVDWDTITRERAVDVLTRFIETGEVMW